MSKPKTGGDVARLLETHVTLLDTSFSMQPGFADFVRDHAESFRKNRLLVPSLVVDELKRLAGNHDDHRRESAERAMKQLKKLLDGDLAELRAENSDTYVDHVILRVVEQHMLLHDMLVLTNDAPLMRDLKAKLRRESVRSRYDIRVIKLHGRTQKPTEFRPLDDPPGNGKAPKPRSPTPGPAKKPKPAVRPFTPSSGQPVTGHERFPAGGALGTGSAVRVGDQTVTLGRKIGEGGEGAVYEVSGRGELCKVYSPDRLTRQRKEKLQLMTRRKVTHPGICWPSELVSDASGNFRGFVMPRAEGKPLGQTLFWPAPFLRERPDWTRRDSVKLALKVLGMVQHLHEMNVLLGDINPQNILFTDPDRVFLVDCDSVQVERYPCPVGTANFTAPEIQGKDYGTFLRTKEHELFAVATLLFMILVPGKCPYSHTGGEGASVNIRKMEFVYSGDWSASSHRAPLGVWMYCWGHIAPKLKFAFERSFEKQYYGQSRVTVETWQSHLREYQQILSDSRNVFQGPKPIRVGYDLSIMPHSKRYKPGQEGELPYDDTTGYELQLEWLTRGNRPRTAPAVPASPARPRRAAQPARPPKRRTPANNVRNAIVVPTALPAPAGRPPKEFGEQLAAMALWGLLAPGKVLVEVGLIALAFGIVGGVVIGFFFGGSDWQYGFYGGVALGTLTGLARAGEAMKKSGVDLGTPTFLGVVVGGGGGLWLTGSWPAAVGMALAGVVLMTAIWRNFTPDRVAEAHLRNWFQ